MEAVVWHGVGDKTFDRRENGWLKTVLDVAEH